MMMMILMNIVIWRKSVGKKSSIAMTLSVPYALCLYHFSLFFYCFSFSSFSFFIIASISFRIMASFFFVQVGEFTHIVVIMREEKHLFLAFLITSNKFKSKNKLFNIVVTIHFLPPLPLSNEYRGASRTMSKNRSIKCDWIFINLKYNIIPCICRCYIH